MTTAELTAEKVKEILRHSYGTDNWYRPAFNLGMVYTDGIKYFAEQCGAYWLIDVVNSHMPTVMKDYRETENPYYYARISVENHKALFRIDKYNEIDNTEVAVVEQEIPYADLPNCEITLYLFLMNIDPDIFCLLCPSEN